MAPTLVDLVAQVRVKLHDIEELLDTILYGGLRASDLEDVEGDDDDDDLGHPSYVLYPAGFFSDFIAPGESGIAFVQTILVLKGKVPAKGFKIVIPEQASCFQIDSLIWDGQAMFAGGPVPAEVFSPESSTPLELPVVQDKDVMIEFHVTNTGPLPAKFHGMVMFKVMFKVAVLS